jgi:hypothetical protein
LIVLPLFALAAEVAPGQQPFIIINENWDATERAYAAEKAGDGPFLETALTCQDFAAQVLTAGTPGCITGSPSASVVEEMMMECGVVVSYEAIGQWCPRFG